ncbi:MAG: M23 family metallopeptidase [Phascolarctobacterium sp.]|nr:M23 family metallopeptidase [Phascolarctobacterium sp.]
MQEKFAERIKLIIQLFMTKVQQIKALLTIKWDLFCQQFMLTLHTVLTIAKLQLAMARVRLERRSRAAYELAEERAQDIYAKARAKFMELYGAVREQLQSYIARVDAYAKDLSERMQARYEMYRRMWRTNQHFTFWLIPADGSHIAKTHVKKTHLKYAVSGVAAFLVVISVTIGVLAHFAIQNETQKREIAEYKATKQAQEQTIAELQKMAEKNQKQLAYLSKLEDKVRKEMAKTGAELPPKSNPTDYAGKGGPSLGDSSPMGYMLEQEKNIHNEAKAKSADLENLLNAIENENYRKDVTPSQWPTDGGEITSYFGGRSNPFGGYGRDWHPGIDIANYYGAPVYAAASGYVQQSGWYGGYGRYIRISHDFGVQTAYAHMSSISVSAGSYVRKGQVIGYVGSSGYSTGPHLHFEVIKNGEKMNPLKYI